MIFKYWLSPEKQGEFHIPSLLAKDIKKNSNKINTSGSRIINILTERQTYDTTPIDIKSWKIEKRNKKTVIKTSFNHLYTHEYYAAMSTELDAKTLNMEIPYLYLPLIGNDISFYILHYYNTLTFRCSSFYHNDTLFLVTGRSGSGKTHLRKEVIKKLPVNIISDDHICIKADSGSIKTISPIWDDSQFGDTVTSKKIIILFLDDTCNGIKKINDEFSCMSMFIKHCVLYNFDKGSTEKILDIFSILYKKTEFHISTIKNSNNVIKYLEGLYEF